MSNEDMIGKKVRDTKSEYQGDIGEVTDIRHFQKADKTYAVIKWNEKSKHGECYRNYAPNKFGMFRRFRFVS